jgi:hypothetical protein
MPKPNSFRLAELAADGGRAGAPTRSSASLARQLFSRQGHVQSEKSVVSRTCIQLFIEIGFELTISTAASSKIVAEATAERR